MGDVPPWHSTGMRNCGVDNFLDNGPRIVENHALEISPSTERTRTGHRTCVKPPVVITTGKTLTQSRAELKSSTTKICHNYRTPNPLDKHIAHSTGQQWASPAVRKTCKVQFQLGGVKGVFPVAPITVSKRIHVSDWVPLLVGCWVPLLAVPAVQKACDETNPNS